MTQVASEIRLTERAMSRISQIISLQNNAAAKFRIYITGGGCSGFQYGFKLDENQEADDIVVQKTILIDPLSFQYLANAEVDFVRDLQGTRFVVHNPNAETTCGCGSSFALKEE